MKVVALVSGGKDSCFNMMECAKYGHEIVAVANLHPADEQVDELDSFMFQTCGHNIIGAYSECMGVPLFRQPLVGKSVAVDMHYTQTANDEVEDLFQLLSKVKAAMPEVQAVSSGAILSNYQRIRVENVCERLGLVSLAYLWQRDQTEVLGAMVEAGIEAILVKTASMGLDKRHLGQSIKQLHPPKNHLELLRALLLLLPTDHLLFSTEFLLLSMDPLSLSLLLGDALPDRCAQPEGGEKDPCAQIQHNENADHDDHES